MDANQQRFLTENAVPVSFLASVLLVVGLLLAGLSDPDGLSNAATQANLLINHHFGIFYLWFAIIMLALIVGIALSPLGNIRLGGAGTRPEHSFWSWFAMLFCAGMGTGFMFWGGAEPLVHFTHPPLSGFEDETSRKTLALAYTFFHWGLSPWAIYGMTSIATGFLCFNCKYNFRFSDFILGAPKQNPVMLYGPLHFEGWRRSTIDFFTLTAIVFGLAATFGMGILLGEGGLVHLFGWQPSWILKTFIAGIIIAIFWASTSRGLNNGIKTLSNISMGLCVLLLFFIFCFSPQSGIWQGLWNSLGMYLNRLPQMSLGSGEFTQPGWVGDWTVMYWTWWIAWAPFVGVFIALISKGRTLRSMALGILVVPTLFSCLWFSVLGQTAISLQGSNPIANEHFGVTNAALILYQMLGQLPFPMLSSLISLLIVLVFVSNSADSAIYTLARLSSHTEKPPLVLQAGWAILFCILGMTLVLSGGITILRKVTAIAVLPFTVLLTFIFLMVIIRMIVEVSTGCGKQQISSLHGENLKDDAA